MPTITEINEKYKLLFDELDEEFFETIYGGTPRCLRRLKLDRLAADYNQAWAILDREQKVEWVAAGFVEQPIQPPRDLATEIDALKLRIASIEGKVVLSSDVLAK